jgi:hypothetical protein
MAKTLRILEESGWVTKPLEALPENRLTPSEVDQNFLEVWQEAVDARTEADGANDRLDEFDRVSNRSGNFTLALTDSWAWVRVDTGVVTVPENTTVAFPVGTKIWIRRKTSGAVSVEEITGVTINTPNTLAITAEHGTALLVKVGTDEWDLSGDI